MYKTFTCIFLHVKCLVFSVLMALSAVVVIKFVLSPKSVSIHSFIFCWKDGKEFEYSHPNNGKKNQNRVINTKEKLTIFEIV